MTSRKQREFWRFFRDISGRCSWQLDCTFYRLGTLIGKRPVTCLLLSLAICIASSFGLLFWREEVDEVQLFMPKDSHIRRDSAWVEENFRDDLRFESIIVEADNILTPSVLSTIAELETDVRGIVASGHDWSEVCARYLTWFPNTNESTVLAEIDEYVKDFKDNCIYQSILRIWAPDGIMDSVYGLDQATIIKDMTSAINGTRKSGDKFNTELENVKPLLSGIQRDSHDNVIGAKATILNWILKKTSEWAPDWELEFIDKVLFSNRSLPPGMKVYAVTTRSYLDFLHQVLKTNTTLLFAGFSLIILYVVVMLGRFNVVEQRIYLSLLGVSVVGQAILASYGLCFYMGFSWGPIHPVLPFLLLGIGVDNTFVIMQCLDNLGRSESNVDVSERIGRAIRQAGVSITVTSLTDIMAFAIGTTTRMPFLRSFCMFAATGVFFLYIFGILFFVSCLALDERRLQQNRDGCSFRVQKNWKPNSCSQRSLQKLVLTKYIAPAMMKIPVKVCILVTTFLIFGLNIWFVFKVEQKFDPMWYLDPESYPMQYSNKLNEHFPEYGKLGAIYLGSGVDYYEDENELLELYNRLKENSYINQDTLDFWYPRFLNWFNSSYPEDEIENETEMKSYLFEFLLMSGAGQKFTKDIKFSSFPFGDFNITASQIQVQHILMDTTTEQVKAMESIQEIIRSVNLSTASIVSFSPQYVSWTANKYLCEQLFMPNQWSSQKKSYNSCSAPVEESTEGLIYWLWAASIQIIGEELLRNLGLTVCTVAVVTLLLIRNLQTSFWVICCVVFTVVDLVGSMYWMGLTIEISTSIMVLLCAGLAVDYSAHIGNEFTRLQGTKNDRAIETLSIIGTAVFNGGLSTFLAFVLLGGSRSYLFTTFFKLFTALVIFGLFHGLVFLPVALSWFGPENKPVPANEHKSVPFEYQNGYFQAEDATLKTDDSKSTSLNDSSKTTLRIPEET